MINANQLVKECDDTIFRYQMKVLGLFVFQALFIISFMFETFYIFMIVVISCSLIGMFYNEVRQRP